MSNLTKADQFYKKNQYQKAIQTYKAILNENPNESLAFQGLGLCYIRTNRLDDAYSASIKASELDQQLTTPLLALGTIYYLKDDLDKAEGILLQALNLDPRLADAYISLSLISRKRDQIEESIAYSQKAIELNPKSWKAYYNLGLTYLGQYDQNEALRQFWTAFKLSPSRQTGLMIFVVHNNIHYKAYTILGTILAAIIILSHSVFTWPLIIVSIGYIFIWSLANFDKRKYFTAIADILLGILVLLFFIYALYVMPPVFR
jgi:tetratricopeptide (TPR) repeat protein